MVFGVENGPFSGLGKENESESVNIYGAQEQVVKKERAQTASKTSKPPLASNI